MFIMDIIKWWWRCYDELWRTSYQWVGLEEKDLGRLTLACCSWLLIIMKMITVIINGDASEDVPGFLWGCMHVFFGYVVWWECHKFSMGLGWGLCNFHLGVLVSSFWLLMKTYLETLVGKYSQGWGGTCGSQSDTGKPAHHYHHDYHDQYGHDYETW